MFNKDLCNDAHNSECLIKNFLINNSLIANIDSLKSCIIYVLLYVIIDDLMSILCFNMVNNIKVNF